MTRARFRIPTELEAIDRIAPEIRAAAADRLPEDRLVALEIALVEALSNIVRHGQVPAGDAIEVMLETSPGRAEVLLVDTGTPVDEALFDADLPFDPLGEGGRGMPLIRMCSDGLEYRSEDGTNRLRLTFLAEAAT